MAHDCTRALTPMYIVYTHRATHKDICKCKIKVGYTVIIAKVREVRENIKRNRLIWRIIQLW